MIKISRECALQPIQQHTTANIYLLMNVYKHNCAHICSRTYAHTHNLCLSFIYLETHAPAHNHHNLGFSTNQLKDINNLTTSINLLMHTFSCSERSRWYLVTANRNWSNVVVHNLLFLTLITNSTLHRLQNRTRR